MRTDPDGLPHHDDRVTLANALRAALDRDMPRAVTNLAATDLAAAIGALAASRFFGVRFVAEGNADRAWVARHPNPDISEIWDPTADGGVWDFVERLPDPTLYQPTPAGTARVAAKAQANMAVVVAVARRTHALAAGVEPDDE